MRTIWNTYLRLNLFVQALVAALLTLTIALLFGLVIVALAPAPPANLADALAMLLIDKAPASTTDELKALYGVAAIVLLTVWQAVFLMRILTRGHEFRFSRVAALYPHNPLQQGDSDPIVVFRLLNNGMSDLFDVRIDVTLRVFNPRTAVFQHFRCRTINDAIPVFRRGMPFWIAIETGEVQVKGSNDSRALDRAMLFVSDVTPAPTGIRTIDAAYAARVSADHSLDAESFALIVFVLGHDVEMNQAKAGTQVYPITAIEPGFFRSIPPRADRRSVSSDDAYRFFAKADIAANFDIVDPPAPPT